MRLQRPAWVWKALQRVLLTNRTLKRLFTPQAPCNSYQSPLETDLFFFKLRPEDFGKKFDLACSKLPDFLSSDSVFRHSGEQRESRRTYKDALTSQTRVGPFPEALWACSEVPHPHVWARGASFGGWQQGRSRLLDLLFFTNSVRSRFFACYHLSIDAPCPNYGSTPETCFIRP